MKLSEAKATVKLPSVDRLTRHRLSLDLIERFGRSALVEAIRAELATLRLQALAIAIQPMPDAARSKAPILDSLKIDPLENGHKAVSEESVLAAAQVHLEAAFRPSFQPVINLTGTVLHTNLGRAPLPKEALDAIVNVAEGASNLEFDLEQGVRGDRDSHVEALLCKVTGAEAATVVNNNAAAVLLVLNALAMRREVPVSRGELVEIGGSFRIPDIMSRAGCKLIEVGTTNRTHLRDFVEALTTKTALVMKVHTSNYVVQGFTATVPEAQLADACHIHGVPFVVDLGAGSLIDLSAYGLPSEPTPQETLARGADIVMFSGDKLLGGPQVGIIVGKADLIKKIKRSPLKRALRIDKMSMAALEAVLRLYLHPERLQERLPVLRLLTRSFEAIQRIAETVRPVLALRLAGWAEVKVVECASEIGSGAQPGQRLKSAALSVIPLQVRGRGGALKRLQSALRGLPVPVIGRIEHDALVLDLRCVEDEQLLLAQFQHLSPPV
jgi:L-seryl-tRNA(Ser) seleniumtransferase